MNPKLLEQLAGLVNGAKPQDLETLLDQMPQPFSHWLKNNPVVVYGILGLLGALFVALGLDTQGIDAQVFEDLLKAVPVILGISTARRKAYGPLTVERSRLVADVHHEVKRRKDTDWAAAAGFAQAEADVQAVAELQKLAAPPPVVDPRTTPPGEPRLVAVADIEMMPNLGQFDEQDPFNDPAIEY